ncbi:MAG: DUF4139 domain-containing protein [Clostridiales bacterium]|nr:DUF4139 domain-containing protein [Clostridiales bacterium]
MCTVLQYRITVKNPSESEKTFTITDELPEGTTFVSADNGGVCEDGVVTWTLTLKGGETKTVALFVTVADAAAGSFVQNQASVTVDGAAVSTNVVKTYVEEPSEETTVTIFGVKTGDDNQLFLWR